MRICPQCRQRYDDDVDVCPEDGTELSFENVPSNPRLRDVLPVDEGAETCMLEVGGLREELSRPSHTPVSGSATDPDPVPGRRDTGELDLGQAQEAQVAAAASIAPTERVPGRVRKRVEDEIARSRLLTAWGIVLAVVLALTGMATWLLWPQPTFLNVSSVPSGAVLEIDGVLSGQTPVALAVAPGPHSVKLELEGHQTFAQVIDIPKEGRHLAVALLSDAESQDQTEQVGRDSIQKRAEASFKEIEVLIDVGQLDVANDRLQTLAQLLPDDPRVAALLERVAALQKQQQGGGSTKHVKNGKPGHKERKPDEMSRKERELAADEAYRRGLRLFEGDQLDAAKDELLLSIRLDPRFFPPHRVLARIYNRKQNVAKTKYHLTRYIELGGTDPDYKIRQWLSKH